MEVRGRAGEGVVYAAGSVEATAEGAKAAIRKFSRNQKVLFVFKCYVCGPNKLFYNWVE